MPSNHLILCRPFLLLPSVFPSIRSFPMSWLFASGGQSIGASASVLPMNIQGWFLLGWTGLTSLLSVGLSRVFSNTTIWKHQFFGTQPSLWSNSHIHTWLLEKSSVQFIHSDVSAHYDPMDCSMPGFPVHHQLSDLLKLVHWVSDTIQPSHPLWSPSPSAFNLSQHQGLFQWVGSSYQVAKVLELKLQHQSFQWIFRVDFPLRLAGLQEDLWSKGLSRVFSNTTIWKHQFLGAQPSSWSNSYIHTWLLENPELWLDGPLSAK